MYTCNEYGSIEARNTVNRYAISHIHCICWHLEDYFKIKHQVMFTVVNKDEN